MIDMKNGARPAGALFLLALLLNGVGSEMLDAVVAVPDYLATTLENRTRAIVGVLLEMLSAAAVVGIAVLLYPVLKRHNPRVALAYLCFRMLEPVITVLIVLAALVMLSLGQLFAQATGDAALFALIGELVLAAREWALMLYILIFTMSSLMFYSLLFKARLVPRLFPIWGLAGVGLLLSGAIATLFGMTLDPMFYGAVLGVNELALAVWMMVKGFAEPARGG